MRLVTRRPVAQNARMNPLRLALPLLLLAGCGDPASETQAPDAGPDRAPPQAGDDRVECALGGEGFARDCTLERTRSEEGTILTIRQPDGGFRRLQIVPDGRGVVAADGAEPAEVTTLGDDRIEVTIGGERYRLPATVGPVAAPRP